MEDRQNRTVAVVTGGRSGIGRKTAERLVSLGVTVYVPGRTAFEAEGMTFLSCDVTKEEETQRAIDTVLKVHLIRGIPQQHQYFRLPYPQLRVYFSQV